MQPNGSVSGAASVCGEIISGRATIEAEKAATDRWRRGDDLGPPEPVVETRLRAGGFVDGSDRAVVREIGR